MSDLKSIEKFNLEKILEMEDGYVLNFSNQTFKNFIIEHTEIDIYEGDKYLSQGSSKANRLRAFWEKESNHIVGKLISAFLEYWKEFKSNQESSDSLDKEDLFDKCLQIVNRLFQSELDSNEEDRISVDTHFQGNQDTIIKEIESAKFLIWVAVAWFTDPVLFEKLSCKRKQGVNVQLIIIDDDINNKSGLKYEEEFETHKIPKIGDCENIMHHKFCIIDLKKVIHGSYNWTKKAKYNHETVTTLDSQACAEKFAEEFIALKLRVNQP